jgi:hypothetical protein
MSGTHEDFGREVRRSGPSDRNFGLVISAALAAIGFLPMRHHHPVRWWALVAAICLVLITAIKPSLLHSANLIWMRAGFVLGKVVNPIVIALLFFLVFTPAAMILRWMKKDLLGLRINPDADTYWVSRAQSTAASSMADQF